MLKHYAKICQSQFMGLTAEQVIVVPLSSKGIPLGITIVATGSCSGVMLRASQVLQVVREAGAKSFVMAHNHLTGWSYPSALDRQTTQIIATQAQAAGLQLVAHLIIAQRRNNWSWSNVTSS